MTQHLNTAGAHQTLASPPIFQLPWLPGPRRPQKALVDLTNRLDSGKSAWRRGPGQGEARAQSREAGEGPTHSWPQDRHSRVYFCSSCLKAEQGEFRTGTEEKQAFPCQVAFGEVSDQTAPVEPGLVRHALDCVTWALTWSGSISHDQKLPFSSHQQVD